MPVIEACYYLPPSNNMRDAFNVPKREHFTIGKTPEEVRKADLVKVAKAGADFFTAGVAYLANKGHDEHMQKVGTVAWWTVNQLQAIPLFTDNMPEVAIRLGFPSPVAHTEFGRDDEPKVIYRKRQGTNTSEETAYVLMSPEFVAEAQANPIGTLAIMAYICSQIYDMANGRLTIDPKYFTPRASATEAHFLREAARRHPEVLLSKHSLNLLDLYPKGIYSLPPEALYKGISGTEFKSARNN